MSDIRPEIDASSIGPHTDVERWRATPDYQIRFSTNQGNIACLEKLVSQVTSDVLIIPVQEEDEFPLSAARHCLAVLATGEGNVHILGQEVLMPAEIEPNSHWQSEIAKQAKELRRLSKPQQTLLAVVDMTRHLSLPIDALTSLVAEPEYPVRLVLLANVTSVLEVTHRWPDVLPAPCILSMEPWSIERCRAYLKTELRGENQPESTEVMRLLLETLDILGGTRRVISPLLVKHLLSLTSSSSLPQNFSREDLLLALVGSENGESLAQSLRVFANAMQGDGLVFTYERLIETLDSTTAHEIVNSPFVLFKNGGSDGAGYFDFVSQELCNIWTASHLTAQGSIPPDILCWMSLFQPEVQIPGKPSLAYPAEIQSDFAPRSSDERPPCDVRSRWQLFAVVMIWWLSVPIGAFCFAFVFDNVWSAGTYDLIRALGIVLFLGGWPVIFVAVTLKVFLRQSCPSSTRIVMPDIQAQGDGFVTIQHSENGDSVRFTQNTIDDAGSVTSDFSELLKKLPDSGCVQIRRWSDHSYFALDLQGALLFRDSETGKGRWKQLTAPGTIHDFDLLDGQQLLLVLSDGEALTVTWNEEKKRFADRGTVWVHGLLARMKVVASELGFSNVLVPENLLGWQNSVDGAKGVCGWNWWNCSEKSLLARLEDCCIQDPRRHRIHQVSRVLCWDADKTWLIQFDDGSRLLAKFPFPIAA